MKSKENLRGFGLVVGAGFLALGVVPFLKGHSENRWFLVLGMCLLLMGLLFPNALKWPYRIWMKLGHVLGAINTRIILTLLFFAVVCPTALIMRTFAKNPMKKAKRQETYWVACEEKGGRDTFERQF